MAGQVLNDAEPEKLVCYADKRSSMLLLFGCWAFVLIGLWLTRAEDSQKVFWGWATVLFFGGVSLALISALVSTGPLLIVDANGIWRKRPLRTPIQIPWESVADLKVTHSKGQPFVSVFLTREAAENHRDWAATLNRMLGAGHLSFSAGTLDRPASEIIERATALWKRHR